MPKEARLWEIGQSMVFRRFLAGIVICLAIVYCSVVLLYFYRDALLSDTGISIPINPGISAPIIPSDRSNLPEWTIIVYSAADDDVLEEDPWFDSTKLSAIESARIPDVITAMNQLISTIAVIDQEWVVQGREYARGYYGIFMVTPHLSIP